MKMTDRTNKMALAAGTVSAAVAIGFVMQSGSPLEASAVLPPKEKQIAASLTPAMLTADLAIAPKVDGDALPVPPRELFQEATLPARPIVLAVAADLPTSQMPIEEDAPMLGCDISVKADPAVAAMVNLSITADCMPDAQVVISHAGLTFTEFLDADGSLGISVPAMRRDAHFSVEMPNGHTASARIDVPSLQFYDRVALQWMGESGLQIHAREFGAAYGEDGHVWFGNERDLTAVINGNGGFLLRLGDGLNEISQMADVYTFPSASAAQDGEVVLTVEAEVNGSNCNRDIHAQSLTVQTTGAPEIRSLDISIPDCVATGDFLVLKNLLQDLTIAQK